MTASGADTVVVVFARVPGLAFTGDCHTYYAVFVVWIYCLFNQFNKITSDTNIMNLNKYLNLIILLFFLNIVHKCWADKWKKLLLLGLLRHNWRAKTLLVVPVPLPVPVLSIHKKQTEYIPMPHNRALIRQRPLPVYPMGLSDDIIP